jgi:hypothetical protein
MLRHVVCLTWADTATPEQIEAVIVGLRALPGQIPEIRAYTVGSDRALTAGNADLGIVADFDTVEQWRTYQEHPAHQAVIVERIRPILVARAAVQFDPGP